MTASLSGVEVRAVVAPGLDPGAPARLSRALGDPLLAALPSAFAPLDDMDAGAYWVLRELHVHATLDGVDADVAVLAARIAGALAEGIAAAVRAGPSAEAMRFAGRAPYVAAYAASRMMGITGGWVFAPLGAFDAMQPSDALTAAARAMDVQLPLVVAEFARQPGWRRMVESAAPAASDRLLAALRSAVGAPGSPSVSGPGVVRSPLVDLAVTDGRVLDARGLLEVLGRAVQVRGATPDVLDEVLALPAADADRAAGRRGIRHEPGPTPGSTAPPATFPEEGPVASGTAGTASRSRIPHRRETFAAPGAAAFLLLDDLDELAGTTELTEPGAAAAIVRARVLQAVLGPAVADDDPALRMAAGVDDASEADAVDTAVRRLLTGPVADLVGEVSSDPVRGWQHPGDAAFVRRATDLAEPESVLAIALLRRFARHLPGFGRSSPAWLLPQVLPPGGRVAPADDLIEVVLPLVPLGVVLALAGLDAFVTRVPWLPVPTSVSHEDRP